MALKAFKCPHDEDSWATLQTCEQCPVKCAPIQLMRAVWEDEVEDDGYHADPMAISVTQTLGCIRKGYLTAAHDYPETLERLLAMWIGSTIHARLEAAGGPDDQVEETFSIDLGDGYTFKGSVDVIDTRAVLDWKSTGHVPTKPHADNIKQLHIYRSMAGADVPPEVCYIGFKGVSTFLLDIPADDSELKRALTRARKIKAVLMGKADPVSLTKEGVDKAFGRKTECDYCPVVNLCEAVEVES